MSYLKTTTFRSAALRRLVASLPCQNCGLEGHTQAAHRNEGKSMGLKTSDALIAALCAACHARLDQGKDMTQAERRDFWNRACINTYQALIESHQLITIKEDHERTPLPGDDYQTIYPTDG